jgi:dephospho-CoA kinase
MLTSKRPKEDNKAFFSPQLSLDNQSIMNSTETESILVGLTGGIASGKSTVIRYLRDKGYSIIDADKLGHRVLEPGTHGYKKVVETFGKGILHPEGTVNRPALGKIVFLDPQKLKRLNEISHPIIADMIQKEYEKLVSDCVRKIVFLEAAILIEANWHKVCQHIWVVTLVPEIAMLRLQERDGLNKTEAQARIESQLSPDDRLAYADVVLKNEGSQEDLIIKTQHALQELKQL